MTGTTMTGVGLFAIALAAGCGGDGNPVAPDATEPFPVNVATRVAAQGEPVPAFQVTQATGLTWIIKVTRPAMCATIVNSFIWRGTYQIAIVSHVSPDPTANCAPIPPNEVVDYTGSIFGLAHGRYLIQIFEGEGDRPPGFMGSVYIDVI